MNPFSWISHLRVTTAVNDRNKRSTSAAPIIQTGHGHCSICGAKGVNSRSCPGQNDEIYREIVRRGYQPTFAMDSHRHARQASRQKLPIIPRTFDRRPLAQVLCIDHQQGRRATMEDTEVVLLENDFQIFGVFDGHGGSDVSQTLARELAPALLHALRGIAHTPGFARSRTRHLLIRRCIGKVFIDLDSQLFERRNLTAGSTAVVAVRRGSELYLANLGDSRAILCQGGHVLASTVDHKPDHVQERTRIQNAGGYVQAGRVNGVLAVSRAFGDWDLKKTPDGRYAGPRAPVSSAPVIVTINLPKTPTVLLLACDGLWDVYTNHEVAQLLARAPGSCTALTSNAINERGSQDNVTVMSVLLSPSAN